VSVLGHALSHQGATYPRPYHNDIGAFQHGF
jgi:hypothetical protein